MGRAIESRFFCPQNAIHLSRKDFQPRELGQPVERKRSQSGCRRGCPIAVAAGTMDEAVTIMGRVENGAGVWINESVAYLLGEMKCHPEDVVVGSSAVEIEACLQERRVII